MTTAILDVENSEGEVVRKSNMSIVHTYKEVVFGRVDVKLRHGDATDSDLIIEIGGQRFSFAPGEPIDLDIGDTDYCITGFHERVAKLD